MIQLTLNPKDNLQQILDSYLPDETLEIHLTPGTYHQTLRIKHNHLKLFGSNAADTIIEYNNYSYKMHDDGLLYNTFRTPVVTVLSNYVELSNLTIKNTSGFGPTIGQAIALSIYGDKTKVDSCNLLGHQDTLFIGPLPVDLTIRYDQFLPIEERSTIQTISLFNDCFIEGDVDFIFGSGTALFNQCTIIALNKGYICAPSTYETFKYGFIFNNCEIISQSRDFDVYLARPWRDHGSTIFYQSKYIGKFAQERFNDWSKSIYRFSEYPHVESIYAIRLPEEGVKQLNTYVQSIQLLHKMN